MEVILYGIGVFQAHMMNKSQVGTRLLSVYIDTVGAIHVIVPTFALEVKKWQFLLPKLA